MNIGNLAAPFKYALCFLAAIIVFKCFTFNIDQWYLMKDKKISVLKFLLEILVSTAIVVGLTLFVEHKVFI